MMYLHYGEDLIIVLKTGLDRPVRPVEWGTGQVSGPGISEKSIHPKIGIESAKPVENR